MEVENENDKPGKFPIFSGFVFVGGGGGGCVELMKNLQHLQLLNHRNIKGSLYVCKITM